MQHISPLERLYTEQLYHETVTNVDDMPQARVNALAKRMLGPKGTKAIAMFYSEAVKEVGREEVIRWLEYDGSY